MSKKLLLADDSITIQKVIGITFANEDYDLTIVDNGEAALQKAKAERPDLILADIFMPGKDGYELCAAVKQEPSLQSVPVLLLTGTFEPFDEDKARSSGADSWIAKPFESQALIERVEELLAAAPQAPAAEPTPAPPVTEPAAAPSEPPAPAPEPAPAAAAPEPAVAEPEPAAAASAGDEWEDTFEFDEDDSWGAVSLDEEELGAQAPSDVQPAGAEKPPLFDGEPSGFAEEPEPEQADLTAPEAAEPQEDEDLLFEDEPFGLADDSDEGFLMSDEEEGFGFEEDFSTGEETAVEAPEPEPEIFSTEIAGEEDFVFGEETDAVTAPEAPADEPPTPEPEEEVLTLDEVDILEEEDLEEEDLGGEDLGGEEEPWAQAREAAAAEALVAEEEIWGEASAPAMDESAAAIEETSEEDDFSLVEEGPEWGEIGEEAASVAEPAPAEPAPEATPTQAAVEDKVRSLSDEELSEVVEKVAGEVVERLAGTILEKIAWEVVPDLAESLIKDEIRKIKEGAQ